MSKAKVERMWGLYNAGGECVGVSVARSMARQVAKKRKLIVKRVTVTAD